MTSGGHIERHLLEAFAAGEVGPDLAVEIAQHIDVCPACAGIAHSVDPCSVLFASCDDAAPPAELLESLLAAEVPLVSATGPVAREPWVAAGLLTAAALVSLLSVSPTDGLIQVWMLLKALGVGAMALMGMASVSWPLAAVAAAGALVLTTGASHVLTTRRMAA